MKFKHNNINNEHKVYAKKYNLEGDISEFGLMFEKLKLSPLSELYFISSGFHEFAGPITEKSINKKEKPFLHSGDLLGNGMYVVLIDKSNIKNNVKTSFKITSITFKEKKDFKSARISGVAPSSHCYPEYNDFANSSGRVRFFGRDYCSFTLINNELNNRRRLALSARHCLKTNILDFNIDPSDYGSPVTNASFYIPYRYLCGTSTDEGVRYQCTGATYLTSRWAQDFLLVEMDDQPPIFVKYLGWDRNNYSQPTSIFSLHNSGGTPYNGRQHISFGNINNDADVNKYKITWTLGETKPGGSGGPLFRTGFNQIIGGLSYAIGGVDRYFKLSSSWNPTTSDNLKQYLSPNQNLLSMQWLDPVAMAGPSVVCFGQNATINMPNLIGSESVTWSVGSGLNIVSNTGKSITVTPSSSNSIGKIAVTASYFALQNDVNTATNLFTKTFDIWVGKPTIVVKNSTTNSTASGNAINFSTSQTNNLSLINGASISSASWSFPTNWNKSSSTGFSTQVYSYTGAGPFTVSATNSCGISTNTFFVNSVALVKDEGLVIFPNVARETLYIKVNKDWKLPNSIQLINTSGTQILQNTKIEELEFNPDEHLLSLKTNKNIHGLVKIKLNFNDSELIRNLVVE